MLLYSFTYNLLSCVPYYSVFSLTLGGFLGIVLPKSGRAHSAESQGLAHEIFDIIIIHYHSGLALLGKLYLHALKSTTMP